MRTLAISLLIIAAPAVAFLAHVVHRSRQLKLSRRPLKLVGRVATVERALSPEGFVLVDGELWRARVSEDARTARASSKVRVVGASGCVVEVEPFVEVEPAG
jgi:membrane protein implicated in regulation of membrane protease activity